MPAPRSPAPPAAFAGIATVVLTLLGWSSIPLFLRFFTGYIDGWTANGWRYAFAAAIWAPAIVLALRRGTLPPWLWSAALVPSLFNALGQAAFAIAPYHVGPGLMTFSLRVQIVFVTAGAALLFASERRIVRRPGFLAGVAVVILGTSGTILLKDEGLRTGAPAGGHETLGIALSIGSGLLYACYALSVRHYLRGVNPITAFAVISQYTAIALLPPMVIFGRSAGMEVLSLPADILLYLALSSIIGIGLGHTLYYVSIERLGVAVSAGVIQLQPIIVAAASTFLFNERMNGWQWLSGAAAIAGAAVILWTQHRASRRPPATPAEDLEAFKTLPVDAAVASAVAEKETHKAR
ncbi:MAG: DMT family transporter [Phycisphaerales bacterium]